MEKIFVYSWHVDDEYRDNDESKSLSIRAYGFNPHGKTVCLHVEGFCPYFFVEVRMKGDWTVYKNYIINKINDRYECKQKSIARKEKLYFYQDRTKHPFLRMRFPSIEARRSAFYRLNKYKTRIMGKDVQFFIHEQEATPLLQLVCEQDIPTAGWFQFRPVSTGSEETQCDYEYTALPGNLFRMDEKDVLETPAPSVLSFDIEVYSSNPKRMPCHENEKDCIFQISSVVQYASGRIEKNLISLGRTSEIGDVSVIHVDSERDLLLEWQKLVRRVNPNLIIGYNIFGFDIPYMIARAKRWGVYSTFDVMGMHLTSHAREKEIKWSSSAYSNQQFHLLETEGRLMLDLLPILRRDYKFSNYRLKTVSTFFLGETKDPLTHLDIFRAYEEGQAGKRRLITRCGKYCVQDANLVACLFEKLQLWIGLVEMSKVCNVPIMFLFTQGQQIRVYSQVYKKGVKENILIQSAESLDTDILSNEGYAGAYVFPPVPGMYEWVIPWDFSSLYPSTIIAYNIDYSTLVVDESIPDDKCHVIEWDDHVGCVHDKTVHNTKPAKILCGHHRYRFIKEPQGVIPGLLKDLLDMRSRTKKQMKSLPKSDNVLLTSLDKRQLAYKVSANSMYGAMGVKRGYLPFIPGAMCTTAMGRISIQRAADYVKQKYSGQLIYGDTDSIYCHLATKPDAKSVWALARLIEKDFVHLFPPPMKLVFEDKLYKTFLILTKKRYMAYTCNEEGTVDDKLTIRGVLLARRDNCKWIREVYEIMVRLIMENQSWRIVEQEFLDNVMALFVRQVPFQKFIITKSVGSEYKIKELPTDPAKLRKRLEDLHIKPTLGEKIDIDAINRTLNTKTPSTIPWVREYIDRTKPAHVQLADKMSRRGHPVEAGSRIEYVIVDHPNQRAKQFEKIEDPLYCHRHGDLVHIDCLYYLQSMCKPIDQLFEVVYHKKDYVSRLVKLFQTKRMICDKIIHRPVIRFVDQNGRPLHIK